MATFDRGWKAAIELPRSAVWEPKLPQCWKPAIKLPRSAVWGHSAEKRPSNCQGRQFENMYLIMDWANGWKAAIELPRSAVWGPKAPKCWKPAMKLPRLAVWERGHETAKVGSLRAKAPNVLKTGHETAKVSSLRSQCWKAAVKLPRVAVWVHKKKCGSNCRGQQFYGHFFKLTNMAGLPKCYVRTVPTFRHSLNDKRHYYKYSVEVLFSG